MIMHAYGNTCKTSIKFLKKTNFFRAKYHVSDVSQKPYKLYSLTVVTDEAEHCGVGLKLVS